MSRNSEKCRHAKRFNGLFNANQERWASQVLNMDENPKPGPDLLGYGKFVEVKSALINPKGNSKTSSYPKAWTVQEHQVEYDKLWTGNGFWALGFYELTCPIEDIEIIEGEDREERIARFEPFVLDNRNIYIVVWRWIDRYSPSKVKYNNTFRYAKFKDIPRVRDTYRVDKGLVHLTTGVPRDLWDDIQTHNP